MEDIVKTLQDLSDQLDSLKKAEVEIDNAAAKLKAQQNLIVKDWVKQHGWAPIAMGGEKYLPYQSHTGRYGLRKL